MSVNIPYYVEEKFAKDVSFTLEINEKMKVPDKIVLDQTNNSKLNQNAWSSKLIRKQPPSNGRTRIPLREIVIHSPLSPSESPSDYLFARTPSSIRGAAGCSKLGAYDNRAPPTNPHTSLVPQSYHQDLKNSEENPSAEIILHMLRQVAKLHQRVLLLEQENCSRSRREMFFTGFALAYCLLKAFSWVARE